MKPALYIVSILLVISYFRTDGLADDHDFGIGMVFQQSGKDINAAIYSKPDLGSDTIITLSGWEYTIRQSGEKTRAVLVGFRKYDYWGLPLLSMTPDSSWAHVSVESSGGTIKTKGWINLKTSNSSVRIWADFLAKERMVLRDDTPLQFYSKPNNNAKLKINLFRFGSIEEYSYVLTPIRREGRWLLVDLQTPFLPCGNDDAIKEDVNIQPRTIRVWIQYLTKEGRPLVRAPMMC